MADTRLGRNVSLPPGKERKSFFYIGNYSISLAWWIDMPDRETRPPGAAGKFCLRLLPEIPFDDGKVVVSDGDESLFAVVGFFQMGEVIGRDRLFLAQVTGIFFVAENFDDNAGRPAGGILGRDPFCQQFSGYLPGALAFFCIFVVNPADSSRLFFINKKAAVPHGIP